jgi:hypothetical protein
MWDGGQRHATGALPAGKRSDTTYLHGDWPMTNRLCHDNIGVELPNLLVTWTRIILDKLIVSQLVKGFTPFREF